MTQDKAIIALVVENNAGVLSRVAMLFGRRGYNIDSLTVSETQDPAISRITITTSGDKQIIEQIVLQTKKLVEVLAVRVDSESDTIQRELLLVKLAVNEAQRSGIREICEIYKGSIVDLSSESLVVELTGKPSKIDGFLEVIGNYKIIELCRTGVTTMGRGNNSIQYEMAESHRA